MDFTNPSRLRPQGSVSRRALKPRKWKTLNTDTVYQTPIFDLHRRRMQHPHRGDRDFFVLEAPTWVNIIPITRQREVVMVRQYRHGIGAFTLEIPGGMMDPGDPDPMAAARREMLEESGFDSTDIVEIGRVHPNPAIQPNYTYFFVARNAHRVRKQQLDANEEAEVLLVPLASIKGLIASGRITHALVIAAFSFFHLYNPPPRTRKTAKAQSH
jgi:8-oxo-dGTP pyrophosphatase MutT (NUDIX family)